MVEYRLKIDGDDFEKIGWDLFIQNKFPNYEVFWMKHIAPKTNRPHDIWMKTEVPENFRIISSLHYGIFQHYFYIFTNLKNVEDFETFRNLFIRIASISDLTEEFVFRSLQYLNKLPENSSIVNKYKDSNFRINVKEAEKRLNKGSNYSIAVINKSELIVEVFPKFKEFKEFSDQDIRSYRNIMIHSWPLFQYNNMIPKIDKISNFEYRDWGKIVEKIKQGDFATIQDYYISKEFLISAVLSRQLQLINQLWSELIQEYEKDISSKRRSEVVPMVATSQLQSSTIINDDLVGDKDGS